MRITVQVTVSRQGRSLTSRSQGHVTMAGQGHKSRSQVSCQGRSFTSRSQGHVTLAGQGHKARSQSHIKVMSQWQVKGTSPGHSLTSRSQGQVKVTMSGQGHKVRSTIAGLFEHVKLIDQ